MAPSAATSTVKSHNNPPTTQAPTQTQPPDPNLTKCPAPLYYRCGGGDDYDGCNRCERGSVCTSQNRKSYSMVRSSITDIMASILFSMCGTICCCFFLGISRGLGRSLVWFERVVDEILINPSIVVCLLVATLLVQSSDIS